MRVSDLIGLGKEYAFLGIVVASILMGIAWCIRKFAMKKQEKVNWISWGVNGIFICYLIVVLSVTMLGRGAVWSNGKIMPLFYSYKDAWVNFSQTAWRNIILNICMFVPFGFFLPICVKKINRFWQVALAGFLFTLGIEGMQYYMKLGIFELDDLLGNTMGSLIGYGCFVLAWGLFSKQRREMGISWKKILCFQIPLVIEVIVFGSIFMCYQAKDLGNLPGQCIIPYEKEQISVSSKMKFNEEKKEATVYQCKIFSKEEVKGLVSQIFEELGTEIDESRNDFYEDVAVFYAKDRYSIWIDYKGGTYELIDFQDDAKRVKMEEREREFYKKVPILSEKEAFQKIKNGEFGYRGEEKLQIDVFGCTLDEQLDSKGFEQPVYKFDCRINGREEQIVIAAVR